MSSKRVPKLTATLAAAALLSATAVATTAQAQMAEPDDQAYMLYHQAIYAAAQCEGRNFYQGSAFDEDWTGPSAEAAQSAQLKMAQVIGQKTGYGTRAENQLVLIEEAKNAAHELILAEGCQGSNVQTLIGLFHSDLAPAL